MVPELPAEAICEFGSDACAATSILALESDDPERTGLRY